MLLLFVWWTTTANRFSISSQYFALHHSISWEFTDPCCPPQGFFPSPTVQTLVSLSGNNWSVGWSYLPASLCYVLDVLGLRKEESLSIRKGRRLHSKLRIMWTMTAISVDRLLALLLRLRYTQIVTLKRTYIIVAMFWVLSGLAASCFLLDYRITFLYGRIVIPSCLLISIVSYTKIFRTLSHHQAQVQDHIQQQPSHSNALNIVRYRKAVNGALWVQLALVVCYAPHIVVEIVMAYSEISSSHLVIKAIAVFLIFFNSTLNPFLYCWKIKEVRQAATQTIKQTLCCPRS